MTKSESKILHFCRWFALALSISMCRGTKIVYHCNLSNITDKNMATTFFCIISL